MATSPQSSPPAGVPAAKAAVFVNGRRVTQALDESSARAYADQLRTGYQKESGGQQAPVVEVKQLLVG